MQPQATQIAPTPRPDFEPVNNKADAARVDPVASIPLPYEGLISSTAISPDGRTSYVCVRAKVFDFGRMLGDTLPAWSALLATILLMLALRSIWRTTRNKQLSGARYCRKCHSQLAAGVGTQCTECGADAPRSKPIVGRRTAARLRFPLATFAISVSALAGLLLADVTQAPRAWLSTAGWVSPSLGRWWTSRFTPPNPFVARWFHTEAGVILAVDNATGATRELHVVSGGALSLATLDDGAVACSERRNLFVLDPEDAASLRRLAIPPDETIPWGQVFGTGSTRDLVRFATVRTVAGSDSDTQLWEWDPRTGSRRALASAPARVPPSQEPGASRTRFQLGTLRGEPAYVSFWEGSEPDFDPSWTLGWYDRSGQSIGSTRHDDSNFDFGIGPVFDGTGRFWLAEFGSDSGFLTAWRPSIAPDGVHAEREWIAASSKYGNPVPRAVGRNGELLLLRIARDLIVLDLPARLWRARLINPSVESQIRLSQISRDGTTVIAVERDHAPSTLHVWKVPQSPPPD